MIDWSARVREKMAQIRAEEESARKAEQEEQEGRTDRGERRHGTTVPSSSEEAAASLVSSAPGNGPSPDRSSALTELNPSPQESALTFAQRLVETLDRRAEDMDLDLSADRQELLDRLRDSFLAKRLESGIMTERLRTEATATLTSRLSKMSDRNLIQVLQAFHQAENTEELAVLLGRGGPMVGGKRGGVNIFTQNVLGGPPGGNLPPASQSRIDADGSVVTPMRDFNNILEGVKVVADHLDQKKAGGNPGDIRDADSRPSDPGGARGDGDD